MERKFVRPNRTRVPHFSKISFLFIFLTLVFSTSAFGFYAPLTDITVTYNATNTELKLSVYDPYRGTNVESGWLTTNGDQSNNDYKSSNGVASWHSASNEITVAVYDPARSTPWRTDTISYVSATTPHHENANGMVCAYVGEPSWSGVRIRLYNPGTGGFTAEGIASNSNVDIQIGKNILLMSYTNNSALPYNIVARAYKGPSSACSKSMASEYAITSILLNTSDTITFSNQGNTHCWAYQYTTHSWQERINSSISTTPMAYILAEQTVSGSPSPENVWWFFDYSIANTASSIDFDDNTTSTERSPGHPFVTSDSFTVQQTVSGCGSGDTFDVVITNTIDAPTGSVSISDSDPTYDRSVDLGLSFTPPQVDLMRFKNENDAVWGTWQSASTTYAGWDLSSGYGSKTVYVQYFRDDLDYISQEYSDQINYYPAIAVTYPNGSEYLKQGKQYTITWTYAGSNNVDVELWNNGSYQATIASGVSSGTTSALYTIPVDHTDTSTWIGANYKIRVKDTVYNHYDESDSNFHIGDIWMTSPNGSESLTFRNGTTIQFTAKEIPSDPIKITLWKGGSKVGAIADNITITTADNSIPWDNVGDLLDDGLCTGINDEMEVALGSDFQIQARVGTTAFKDLSDSNFTIDGIRVIAPNGKYCDNGVIQDQVLTIGNSYLIQWDKYSLPTGLLKVILYDGETAKAVLATDLANTTTQFNWTVGKDVNNNDISNCTGTNFRILVRVKDQIILDLSDNPFEIE